MKNFNLSILVFFLVVISCTGQSSKINTFTGEVKINNQLTLGDTKQAAKDIFGEPDDVSTEYWEMSEETVTNYHYNNGAKFQFVNNGLASFVITSSNFSIVMDSFQLQVGNNINSIQNKFTKSYNNRGSDGITSIALGTGDYNFLWIQFDSNNLITKIDLRFY